MSIDEIKNLKTEFLEYLEIEKNRSQLTIRNYDHYLDRFLDWAMVKSPEDITSDLVRKFRLYLNRYKDNKGRNLKKVTQDYYVIALRGFLKYLAKQDIKTLASEKVELGKSEEREVEFLELEEVKRLIGSVGNKNSYSLRDRAILELLFSTGLRVSELSGLDRDSINLKSGEFSIRGKGGKIRLVFISDSAKNAIINYVKKRKDIEPALFVNIRKVKSRKKTVGNKNFRSLRLTPRSIQRIVKSWNCKKSNSSYVAPQFCYGLADERSRYSLCSINAWAFKHNNDPNIYSYNKSLFERYTQKVSF